MLAFAKADFDRALATVNVTIGTTAIMEAGRRSLDNGGARIEIAYPEGDFSCHPIGFVGDVEAATQAAAIDVASLDASTEEAKKSAAE